jgi:hypothetical protein
MLSMWPLYLMLRAHYLFVDGVHHPQTNIDFNEYHIAGVMRVSPEDN